MTWHVATVPAPELISLLVRIRSAGGTVACCRPGPDGVRITWTTVSTGPDSREER